MSGTTFKGLSQSTLGKQADAAAGIDPNANQTPADPNKQPGEMNPATGVENPAKSPIGNQTGPVTQIEPTQTALTQDPILEGGTNDSINRDTETAGQIEVKGNQVTIGGRVRNAPGLEVADTADAYTAEGFQKPVAAYKHLNVRTFKVGKHLFHNHILTLFSDEDHGDFLDCWEGLMGPDKVNIVRYDWEAAARLHTPVDREAVSRGVKTSKEIKDPKQVA